MVFGPRMVDCGTVFSRWNAAPSDTERTTAVLLSYPCTQHVVDRQKKFVDRAGGKVDRAPDSLVARERAPVPAVPVIMARRRKASNFRQRGGESPGCPPPGSGGRGDLRRGLTLAGAIECSFIIATSLVVGWDSQRENTIVFRVEVEVGELGWPKVLNELLHRNGNLLHAKFEED